MTTPLLVAFDLDDTLAPSKAALDPAMAHLLVALAERVEVSIISGAQWGQFRDQVVQQLPTSDAGILSRLHLMPTCGTQYFRHEGAGFAPIYVENLSAHEKAQAIAVVETQARRLGLWEERTAGPAIEDRGSQITYSALGQSATLDDKRVWDPSGEKKDALRSAVQERLPDLEVRSGGSTSIDITRVGIDKAYGMRRLCEATGIDLRDMLFFGDRLDAGGNDYPVIGLGVTTVAVTGWEDTATRLRELIPTLPERR